MPIQCTCQTCGRVFAVPPSRVARSTAPTCSRACRRAAMTGVNVPVEQRIWRHIGSGAADTCWLWTASVDHKGYGQINDGKGRIRKSHQIVLEIALGRPLASGEWALHRCDNPPCCNPDHLYAGTPLDNYRDMTERGRAVHTGAAGIRNCNAKLTDDDIRTILSSLDGKHGTQARLARQYGISPTTIMNIKRRVIWKHVTAP